MQRRVDQSLGSNSPAGYAADVLPIALLILFVAAVVALSRWRRIARFAPRTCCSQHQWPPDDLTGARIVDAADAAGSTR